MAKSWNEKLVGGKPAHVSEMVKPLWGLKEGIG